jgi:hypothetical protein
MIGRLITISLCILNLALIAGCHRSSDDDIIGTWRFEDDHGVTEITFNAEHTFRQISTNKEALAIPSVPEFAGTWQKHGKELLLDGQWKTFTGKAQSRRILNGVTETELSMTDPRRGRTDEYKRLALPSCNGVGVSSASPLRAEDLVGVWQIHYHTHDFQIRFLPNGRFEFLATFNATQGTFDSGDWHVSGDGITFEADGRGARDKSEPNTWAVQTRGQDCLTVTDRESPPFTFRRVK